MFKMNWKVRLRNPVFWLTGLSAVIAFVYTLLGLFGVVPSVSENAAVKAVSVIVSALTSLGVLVDPTTSGVSVSSSALTYDKTYKSDPEGEYTDADE